MHVRIVEEAEYSPMMLKVDAVVGGVTLTHVLEGHGPHRDWLHHEFEAWSSEDIVARYYHETGQQNVVEESHQLMKLSSEERKNQVVENATDLRSKRVQKDSQVGERASARLYGKPPPPKKKKKTVQGSDGEYSVTQSESSTKSQESPTQMTKELADKKKELLQAAEANNNFKALLKPSWQPKIALPGEDLSDKKAKGKRSNVMKNHIHVSDHQAKISELQAKIKTLTKERDAMSLKLAQMTLAQSQASELPVDDQPGIQLHARSASHAMLSPHTPNENDMLQKQVQNLQENLKKLKKAALDVIFSQADENLVNLKTVLNDLIE